MKARKHAKEEDVPILFHDLIHLCLLRGGTLPGGHDLPLTLRVTQKEKQLPGLGDDLD